MLTTILDSRLIALLSQNDWFMDALRAVRTCDPLHGYLNQTSIKDVDVAFFDGSNLTPRRDQEIQSELQRILPGVPWEAKNQAAVHLWYERVFGFPVEPLVSSSDAIATWPEPATCVAVRLLENDDIMVVAPYGLNDLFNMVLRRNPRRITEEIFLDRLLKKAPLEKWPKTKIVYGNNHYSNPEPI